MMIAGFVQVELLQALLLMMTIAALVQIEVRYTLS